MGVAISAIVAALSVIFALSVTTTTTQPITSILQVLLELRTTGRILSADEAMTALLFSVTVYLIIFSGTYFITRFLGLLFVALGVPDEASIRDNRVARRNVALQTEMYRRQAKLIARYLMKANEAQAAQAKRRTSSSGVMQAPTGRGPDALG